jgi:predicted lipid-binding transport protein (Tim44 family)
VSPSGYPDPDVATAGASRGAVHRVRTLAELDAGVGEILAHDPAFSRDDFMAAATRMFYVVQKAWSEASPGLSRQVMADSLWQSHKMQIDQFLANGTRNRLDGLAIQVQSLVGAGIDEDSEYLVVRFFVSSADFTVDGAGKTISGSTVAENWSEDWVFERDKDAKTKKGNGTLASRCPNCGAALDLDPAGICTYCRQPALTGADWVLTRIDQLPSWEWAQANVPQ